LPQPLDGLVSSHDVSADHIHRSCAGDGRYDKLEDGTFAAEIPRLSGVIAFGKSLAQCERELRSTLEDWILVGLHLGHRLPKLAGIELNQPRIMAGVEARF
jgi:predicted RNase H-like HicB family nuclease